MMSPTHPAGERAPSQSPSRLLRVRLAVLDDDSGFVQVLAHRLERLGWEHRVLNRAVGRDALVTMRLHAIVVDPNVLGHECWDYLDRLCASLPGLAVIVCTGPSSVGQRVRGLRLGADDWISKPCHPEEVIARVQAVLRRRRKSERPTASASQFAGELEIRADQYQAFVAGRSLDLTRREFELLALLARVEGQVLEREEIYQRVWGYAMARGDRSVDVFVRKLRQKLVGATPGWSYIHTHFGVGYRFAAELAEPAEATEQAAVLAQPATSPDRSAEAGEIKPPPRVLQR